VRPSALLRLGGALGFFLCWTVTAGAVAAQEEPLQAFREGRSLALVPMEGSSARLELPGGRTLRLDLPDRAEVSTLALLDGLDGGWAVAGSYPDLTGGRRLFLLRGNDETARPLAEPPGQEGAERRGPVLLVDNGKLAGLAWLEGDGQRSLSVRAAAWTGKAWQPPQQVSWPGPGSQLALAGAVLDDGSWLLAWSAFDGQDDEIVWSRRIGETWLPVRRLSPGNSVPDITPALTSVTAGGGGALIAWSRYDGHGYQLRTARFDRGEWRSERAGPAGSLYPTFLGGSDGIHLLYMDAWPRAWSVLALDAEGRIEARASLASTLDRPVVTFERDQVRMRWPAQKRAAAARLEKTP
jgi:hypothetical protein